MQSFATSRDAKEFLVSKIVTEAQCENISLSEIERKNAVLLRKPHRLFRTLKKFPMHSIVTTTRREYEKKIGALIRSAKARMHRVGMSLTHGRKLSVPSDRKITIYWY